MTVSTGAPVSHGQQETKNFDNTSVYNSVLNRARRADDSVSYIAVPQDNRVEQLRRRCPRTVLITSSISPNTIRYSGTLIAQMVY